MISTAYQNGYFMTVARAPLHEQPLVTGALMVGFYYETDNYLAVISVTTNNFLLHEACPESMKPF